MLTCWYLVYVYVNCQKNCVNKIAAFFKLLCSLSKLCFDENKNLIHFIVVIIFFFGKICVNKNENLALASSFWKARQMMQLFLIQRQFYSLFLKSNEFDYIYKLIM